MHDSNSLGQELAKSLQAFREHHGLPDLGPIDSGPAALNATFLLAVEAGATSLSLAPSEKTLSLSLRIQETSVEVAQISKRYQSELTRDLKRMSSLDLEERALPQDGRMRLRISSRDYDCSMTVLPVRWGERVQIRLEEIPATPPSLEALGVEGDVATQVRERVCRRRGLWVLTAPDRRARQTLSEAVLGGLDQGKLEVLGMSSDPWRSAAKNVQWVRLRPSRGLDELAGFRTLLRQDEELLFLDCPRDPGVWQLLPQALRDGRTLILSLGEPDLRRALQGIASQPSGGDLLSNFFRGGIATGRLRQSCSACRSRSESPSNRGCGSCLGTGYDQDLWVSDVRLRNPSLDAALEGGLSSCFHSMILAETSLRNQALELSSIEKTTRAEVEAKFPRTMLG